MVKKPKMAKSFSWALSFKYFQNHYFFYHVYPLHTLIHGLKFILKFKKNEDCKKFVFLIKMVPLGIDSFNFEDS
jgi:hypothetical protein